MSGIDDITDKLCRLVLDRFCTEQPERELSRNEQEGIWFTIFGKLSRGETEHDVAEWCKNTPLARKSIHRSMRNGY